MDPGRVALCQIGAESITFAGWERRSNAVAHGLLDRGLCRGQRVGLLFGPDHWIDYAVAYCAVQKSGGVAVPVHESATASEAAHLLSSCAASFAICGQQPPSLPGIPAIPLSGLDDGRTDPVDIRVRPGDLAQILYTSGTTGQPKGVAASQTNLTFGFSSSPRYRLFRHSDYLIHAFPIGTNAAQAMLIYAITTHPASLRLGRFDSERFCAAIEQFGVGTVFIVPAMAMDLLESRAYTGYDLTSVVMISSGGSTLEPAAARSLKKVFRNATVVNCYTSTEAMPAQTSMIIDDERPASVGLALQAVQIRSTSDHESTVPAHRIEIWLRCPAPPRTYYHDPAATAESFRDGWVRTGDLGYLDEDGYLYLTARENEVIKCGSMKISPPEVEAVLTEHPHVREAAVLGIPHSTLGSMVAAAVVLEERGSIRDVRSFARDRLAAHKVPVRWLELPDLPTNLMGKVVKPRLVPLFQAGPATSADA